MSDTQKWCRGVENCKQIWSGHTKRFFQVNQTPVHLIFTRGNFPAGLSHGWKSEAWRLFKDRKLCFETRPLAELQKMCETFDFPSCCTPQSVKSCKSKHHMLAVMESRLNFDRLHPERRHTKKDGREPHFFLLLEAGGRHRSGSDKLG